MEIRDQIIDTCMEHVRRTGHPPETVAALCDKLEIQEADFFGQFASLDAVEGAYWVRVLETVIGRVAAGDDWANFSAKQRLLTFLFAFVEDAAGFRSLMLARFAGVRPIDHPKRFQKFDARFRSFADNLVDHGIARGEIAERGPVAQWYPEGMLLHFRSVIAFYLADESDGFERTDAFIEKTVALAFDVVGTQAIDSAFDLGRFLLGTLGRR